MMEVVMNHYLRVTIKSDGFYSQITTAATLKPSSAAVRNVRAEARTYLRNKSKSVKQIPPFHGGMTIQKNGMTKQKT
jgi:hypothetical protein